MTPIPPTPTFTAVPTQETLVAANVQDLRSDQSRPDASQESVSLDLTGVDPQPELPRDDELLAIESNSRQRNRGTGKETAEASPAVEGVSENSNWPSAERTEPSKTTKPSVATGPKYDIYRVSEELAGQEAAGTLNVPAKYGVQLASLRTWDRAMRMAEEFRHLGPVFLVPWISPEREEWIRVVIGIYRDRPTSFQMIQYLQHTYRITDALIVENRWWRISPEVGGIEKVTED